MVHIGNRTHLKKYSEGKQCAESTTSITKKKTKCTTWEGCMQLSKELRTYAFPTKRAKDGKGSCRWIVKYKKAIPDSEKLKCAGVK